MAHNVKMQLHTIHERILLLVPFYLVLTSFQIRIFLLSHSFSLSLILPFKLFILFSEFHCNVDHIEKYENMLFYFHK